jgi:hypothetical protein
MTAFRVMLNGGKFMLHLEGENILCGFVKNKYIWAASEAKAIDKAKQRVLSKLSKNSAIRPLNGLPILIEIEEVESGVALWKPLSNESFLFYKLEPVS